MIHEIKIRAVLNGYIAIVGCQTVVFNTRSEMLRELDRYLEKPEETAAHYRRNAVNCDKLQDQAPPATESAPPAAAATRYPVIQPSEVDMAQLRTRAAHT